MNLVMALAHRRDPSWALIILPLFHARGKTKRTSFFYLFTLSISMLIIHTVCRSFWISSNVSLVHNSFTPHHLSALKCIKVVQRNRLGDFRESKGSPFLLSLTQLFRKEFIFSWQLLHQNSRYCILVF